LWLTETRARELISEIVEHATGEPLRNYTAEDWLWEWLQGKKATKTEGTFLKYENAINGFLETVGNRAKFNVNQIAPRDILRFRDAQILDGKNPEHRQRPSKDRTNGVHLGAQTWVYHTQSG